MTDPTAAQYALLTGAAVAAGAINAVAGGGSLVTFPALLAVGYPALAANVTNQVAVTPGYVGGTLAYRDELRGQRERARRLSVSSALGAAAGTALLLLGKPSTFRTLAPFLILAAVALLLAQPRLARLVGHHRAAEPRAPLLVGVFAGAIYGGYFGAGLGIMLLALLGLLLDEPLQRANALRSVLALVIAVVAAVGVGIFGPVAWGPAAVMGVGSLAGGRIGGAVARRLSPNVLRVAVSVLGVAVAMDLVLK